MALWNDHGPICLCIECSDQGKPAGWDEMQDVFSRMKALNHPIPRNITVVMKAISHPEVIEWTQEWIWAVQDNNGAVTLLNAVKRYGG